MGGGEGVSKRPKNEKKPTKIVETGCIKIQCICAVNLTWFCEIDPTKSQNGAGSRFQNGPLQKIETFRGAQDFLGPLNGTRRQTSAILGPKKSSQVYSTGALVF